MPSDLGAAELVAMTLAYSGHCENAVADAVPQSVWDSLHERGMLALTYDIAGDPCTGTTQEGTAALLAQVEVVSHGL